MCETTFEKNSSGPSLNNRQNTHGRENNYFVCETGNGIFSSNSNSEIYPNTRAKENTHICKLCKRKLATKYSLKRHLRLHMKENLLMCDIFQKEFTKTGN